MDSIPGMAGLGEGGGVVIWTVVSVALNLVPSSIRHFEGMKAGVPHRSFQILEKKKA